MKSTEPLVPAATRDLGLTPELLRDEPFRLFFPLAFLLGAAGVSHWVLFTSGAIDRYLGVFHAVTQMQSFMLAFAAGFLMTAIPKRTRSAPASWIEIGALGALIPAISLAALRDRLDVAEIAYAAALVVLASFAIRRFVGRAAGRRPPASFALVPIGFAAGIGGAALIFAGSRPGASGATLPLGRALVFEGTFLCFSLGIGAFFSALALRGEPPPDIAASRGSALAVAGYALAGMLVVAGLVAQDAGHTRLGPLLRAAVAATVLVRSGALWGPSRPGTNRRLIRVAAWAIPAGLAAAAIFPEHRVAAMHVLYVGGFGLLAVTVAAHVALGHAGLPAQQGGRPWPIVAFGALFLTAMATRAIAFSVPDHYLGLLGVAASLWLAGAGVWAVYLLPKMWRAPATAEQAP